MGTPAFAAAALDALVAAGLPPVLVVTTPDAPGRRGKPDQPSAVKVAALRHSLPVSTPSSVKDPAFADEIAAAAPDLIVVVAFKILPAAVFTQARLGAFNLHGSLLPQYRGAAPIQRAVMAGATTTGATTFLLKETVDTGSILLTVETPIGPDETAGDVAERLQHLGADLVVETAKGLLGGTLSPQPQDDALATPAPKLFREEGRLDATRSAEALHNHARGFSPAPGAWLALPDGKALKVLRTQVGAPVEAEGGTFAWDGPHAAFVAGDGKALRLVEVQPEGGRKMPGEAWLRGVGR